MLGLTQKDPLAETPCQSLLRVVRCVSRRCRCEVVAVLAMAVNGCSPFRHLPNTLGLLFPPCHCTCPLPVSALRAYISVGRHPCGRCSPH
jgi:hypothetical protein